MPTAKRQKAASQQNLHRLLQPYKCATQQKHYGSTSAKYKNFPNPLILFLPLATNNKCDETHRPKIVYNFGILLEELVYKAFAFQALLPFA